MTLESWLEAHPYLRPVAELSAEVERAAEATETVNAPVPDWQDYRSDFLAGMTLLHSAAAIDLEPGGRAAAADRVFRKSRGLSFLLELIDDLTAEILF